MRILVLGGTGFIGRSTIGKLVGHDIMVVHRGNSCLSHGGIGHIHCETEDLLAQRDIFHQWKPDVALDFLSRNGPGASRTIQALAGLSTRVVLTSSISVYRSFGVMIGSEAGAIDNSPMDEEAPLRQVLYPYRRTSESRIKGKEWLEDYDKIPAERAFLSQRELPINIIRLPMVYGPGDPDRRVDSYVEQMVSRRDIVLQETASGWRNSRAYVENIAEAIIRIVHAGPPGRIYNIAEEADFTETMWIRKIGEQVGWDGEIRIVPDGGVAGRPRIEELPETTNFAQHLRMDTSRIREDLGFRESVQIAEALRSTAFPSG